MTRICFISDTHAQHMGLALPDADILVHCGDFSGHGTYMDAVRFAGWFGAQPHKHKIFIAGNHDLWLDQGPHSVDIEFFIRGLASGVHYLRDSGIELEGLKFWGSPVQPRFFNWAFNRDRGADIAKHWDLIPYDTDVLITHGPPSGHCDEAPRDFPQLSERVGCADLLKKVKQVKPKIHAFGHIHYSYGNSYADGVHFINASICNEQYAPINKPYLVDINGHSVSIVDIL
jgi:Icc-related predicted phosphoesterase